MAKKWKCFYLIRFKFPGLSLRESLVSSGDLGRQLDVRRGEQPLEYPPVEVIHHCHGAEELPCDGPAGIHPFHSAKEAPLATPRARYHMIVHRVRPFGYVLPGVHAGNGIVLLSTVLREVGD